MASRKKQKPRPEHPKQNRLFGMGESVTISKKSRVVDSERSQEGLAVEDRVPIDQDVTGFEGSVDAPPYWNEARGQMMVPVRLKNDAIVCVPEDRLERAQKIPGSVKGDGGCDFPVSREAFEFWRKFFEKR